MRITVAICTRNRSTSLAHTLGSIAAAHPLREASLDVVVVDNHSTDDTASIIRSYADRLPIQGVWEPEPGLSNARNAAVEVARGDYVLWTDDDVLVGHEWLRGYEDAIAAHPDASFFGGPIEPWFVGGRPAWIAATWSHIAGAYAERELGVEPFRLDPQTLPFGANMAVRLHELRSVRFDRRLGRGPERRWRVGEETALFQELLARGHQGWWVPASRVRHVIPPRRQTGRYLRDYFQGVGRTYPFRYPSSPWDRVFGWPRSLWCRWLGCELRYRRLLLTASPERWVPCLVEAALMAGRLQVAPPHPHDLPDGRAPA